MHFDVIKIGDFRFPGGTSAAIAHEIRALSSAGYSVGLVQKRASVLKQDRGINPHIQACIEAGQAILVEADPQDRLEARLAVIHNPYVFADKAAGLPKIAAPVKTMVGHQPVLDGNGVPYFNVDAVQENAEEMVGRGVVWAPISELSRRNMADAAIQPEILDEDWTNLIFVDDWRQDRSRPVGPRPVIGRHSRPDWPKWPATAEELFSVYPEGETFDVRLLGVGDGLKRLIGEDRPANWTTFEFNEIDPVDFLKTIDYFAYYHHPDWVEGFGRTIAEAAASGAVVILPEHFRPTFGEAALYRKPDEVQATALELHDDWEGYRLQSRIGQRIIDRLYGPTRYLSRIEKLIGKPGSTSVTSGVTLGVNSGGTANSAMTSPGAAPAGKPQAEPSMVDTDIVVMGDFRTARETAWRIANEVRVQHELGYRTALMHVETDGVKDLAFVNPEIDALAREGLARPVDPATPFVRAKLLIVHQPRFVFDRVGGGAAVAAARVVADRAIVVHDSAMSGDEIIRKDALLRTMFGQQVAWAATTPALQRDLAAAGPDVSVEGEVWRPSVWAAPWTDRKKAGHEIPVIGRAGLCDETQWPKDEKTTFAVYPAGREAVVRILGMPHARKIPVADVPESWEQFGILETNPHKFISNLDFFVYVPGETPNEIPEHAIASAMVHGIPAVLPNELKARIGRGPIYAKPEEMFAAVQQLHGDGSAYAAASGEAARTARQAFGPTVHKVRLRRLAGSPPVNRATGPAAPAVKGRKRERVLFISSNGVGLGHLTRLLAIARRMPGDVEPVFATMSQAMPIVAQAGYPVEYLPFHVYANCDPNDWNDWFGEHLSQIIDFHDARAVVFDGGNPYQGLLEALAPRRDTNLVWVRRGMWRETQNNETAIRRQRFFDLVIEPTDIAESKDSGATAYNRAVALKVAPIRLLDEEDLLPREEACERLGLDPARPAALIQLGSGSNRDIVSMIDTVLEKLGQQPDIQPVIAEWLISQNRLDFWPGVKRLRGFPMSKYFNAFDFTISAAGYNSFNEIISFGLPAVFMANDHAMMDDQGGRAAFAQENDAAFHLPDHRADAIGPMVDALMDEKTRFIMKTNCARISHGNGAADAAAAVAGLVLQARSGRTG